ncbi:carbohydrate porin [Ancylobacter radicis]|uniref:Carbohydrate porin n=1 Tax=Ancylobacter radicis TaxID=2836179 RepID=A0ABS5RA59_9HYPH|nr:carbohydrate porin [Ancylobacter radicis]MBS9478555.1 carbohydrate porin [Ancylobacter radicis]
MGGTGRTTGRRVTRRRIAGRRPLHLAAGVPLAFLALLLPAAAQQAAAQTAAAPADDGLIRATLTGDWGGNRAALVDKGVTLSLNWTGEALANAAGGMRQGGTYDGLLEGQLDLDLAKLVRWPDARLHVSGYWIQGRGLSADYVGNLLTVSSIEAEAGWRLNELYLEQEMARGTLSLRIGQIAADTEFWQSQTASLFINSSFGWPALNAGDLPGGGPAYPYPTPGLRLRWSPDPAWSVQAGLYNGNPLGDGDNPHGVDFPLDDGVFAIVEASYVHAPTGGLSGTYRVGAWYNSETYESLSTAANGLSLADPAADGPLALSGNYALYAIADQQLWQGGGSTLSGFMRAAIAPQSDRSTISFYVDAGLALTGLPGRPNDVVGIGLAYAKISPDLADEDRARNAVTGLDGPVMDCEAVVEVTYQAALTPWLSVQPFVQYVIHPGGNIPQPDGSDPTQSLRNAAVLGVRTSVVF